MSNKLNALKMSDRTTLQFLDCYQNERCLWNPQDRKYRNKCARNAALKRISDKLNIEGFGPDLVLQKFKNLRSSYCQELKKIRASVRGRLNPHDDDVYRPSVVWFPKMDSFIKPFVQQRETRLSTTIDTPDTSASDVLEVASSPIVFDEDRKPDLTSLSQRSSPRPAAKVPKPHQEPAIECSQPKRQRVLASTASDTYSTTSTCRQQGMCHHVPPIMERQEDMYDHYGKYIAAVLRSLSPQRAFSLQQQINDIVYAEQMNSVTDQRGMSSSENSEWYLSPSTSARAEDM